MPVAITAVIFAIGNIVFGHVEERTAKRRRVTKVLLVTGLVGLISWRCVLGALAGWADADRVLTLFICGGYPIMASTA